VTNSLEDTLRYADLLVTKDGTRLLPSQYQIDLFKFIDARQGSAVVKAVAGASKSTSIVGGAKLIPISEKAVFLAFNKSIVDELTRKLPPHVKAQTTHSLCFRALNSSGQRLKVDGDKINRLMSDLLSIPEKALRGQIRKLVSMAKANGLVPHSAAKLGAVGLIEDTEEFWDRIIATYSIEFETAWQETTAIDRARDLLKMSLEAKDGTLDFDDMLLLPIVYRMAFPKFDWIFVDEAQDLAPIQHEVLRRIAKPTSHVIAVGDSSQSIYQFRSAMSDSMDVLVKSFNAKVLPLSICYRCAKSIVAEAKTIVPQIEASPNAEDGIVRRSLAAISLDPKEQFAAFTPDAAVLCPYNAPMIEAAYIFIRRKIACRVLGREIGDGLIKLVRKLERDGATNIAQAEKALQAWYMEQLTRLEGKEAQIAAMIDKVDTLNVFLAELPANETIEKLVREIQNLFTDAVTGYLTLSTIHRGKGLEYDKVFFLNSHFLEGDTRRGKKLQAWEIQQRENLRYVAITRARKELIFCTSEELKAASEKAAL
jgi:DNA helicase-2/ATP-dependent DNA helicase PcrA